MTTSKSKISLDVSPQGVATLTLCRPELHNAFDDEVIASFIRHLKSIAANATIKIVVLKAEGKSFCAGADLNWMQRMINYSYDENIQDADQLAELMYQLAHLPQPTIALVNGATYGGGVGLVACCDLVIAQEDVKFCLSEVKLGLMPAVIAPYVLAKIGLKAMQYYGLTAEIFDVFKAQQIGLVDQVVPVQALLAQGDSLIHALLKNGAQAMQQLKKLLAQIQMPKPFNEIRQNTVEAIAQQRISQEGQEGLKAFLEKRKPNW